MSKRHTALTLASVAVLMTGTAAANSFARNARDFGRGYREGYRDAAIGAPLVTAAHAPQGLQAGGRPFMAGYEHGRVEAARRAAAIVKTTASPAAVDTPRTVGVE